MNKIQINRRACLHVSAAAFASAACRPRIVPAQDRERRKLVDTHLHCFAGEESTEFPYHRNAPYRPAPAATPQLLLKLMDEAGVDHAIVVHPEPYQDDHRYLEHCLSVGQGRLKGTVLVFCDDPQSMAKLPSLVRKMDVVAVRVHAYAPNRLPPFGSSELKSLWRNAADLGLAVQLHFEPRYAPGFEPLIKEFADVTVLIDHLGRPFQGTPEEHEVVLNWSKFQNTYMKMSSIPSASSYPHRDIRPIIRRLTESFGPDRMMYGGGFNADATGASYAEAFASARRLLDHLSASQQDAILGGTARKLFQFGV